MNFKVRKIRKKPKKSLWKRVGRKKYLKIGGILLGVVFISLIGWSFFSGENSSSGARKIFSFQGLTIDKNGHTNILLLGVAGKSKEGGHLSDSIMITSIDPNKPSISLLSLPRDLYIKSKIGERKINEIYAAARYKHGDKKGLDVIKDAVGKFAGIDVHYAAVVNFQIFADSIDLLGGIEMFIPDDIEDPFFPDENYGYQTFVIRKGLQTLDGATTLKYVRSRKTSSDYQRALRQQEVLLALRRKAESRGWAANAGKIREFYEIFRRNINTDIGLKEMIGLGKVGMGIDYGNIVSSVLNDDPNQKAGLLYTPAKEFYGGQFVLLPEDEIETATFMNLALRNPDILTENAQISVLNGSNIEGKAGQSGSQLRRLGFHVIDIGNYNGSEIIGRTFIKDLTGGTKPETMEFLKKQLKTNQVEIIDPMLINPNNLVDIEVVLGQN